MEITKILQHVTVDCKDNQHEFIVRDRIDVIESLLSNSSYKLVNRGKLSLIYAKQSIDNKSVILVSSHIDCVYDKLFCKELENGFLHGTFDNSLTNCCILYDMLLDNLEDNVVIAFTGDEEYDSNGAKEVIRSLKRHNARIAFSVVLDVTEVGWEKKCPFTIENDLGVDIETGYEIIKEFKAWGYNYEFVHDAEPDESWEYDEADIPCLTLCIPIKGDMHSDAGCFSRKESLPIYSEAIVKLLKAIQTSCIMESKYYLEYTEKSGGCWLCGIHADEDCCKSDDYITITTKNDILSLPTEIHGSPVFGIEDFCIMGNNRLRESITINKMIIPSSYKTLGKKNFSRWNSLNEVVLYCEDSAMCEWNFAYCDNLKKIRCMNSRIYTYCISLPLEHSDKSYGCFDGVLHNIEFQDNAGSKMTGIEMERLKR